MKRFFLSLTLIGALTQGATAQNGWMKDLSDNRLVTDLSLPGTHDAATAEGWVGLAELIGEAAAKAQDLTIKEQWAVGVRAFDLRPQLDGDVLRCMHGISGTKLLVGDFFARLRDLLAASPSEFAIVACKVDSESEKWANMFTSLLHSDSLQSLFVPFNPRMTVGDVRGKILLLSRNKYDDTPVGGFVNGWSSSKDFADQQGGTITGSNGKSCPLWMQDYYEPNKDREGKETAIRLMLDAAMSRNLDAAQPAWVMNYTAGNTQTFLSDGYRENAEYANQLVIDYLADETHKGSTGMVMMDFAGVDESISTAGNNTYVVKGLQLVNALIAHNFKNQTTGIDTVKGDSGLNHDDAWYTLDGRKLVGKPAVKGIFINKGRKVMQ